jgi:2-polyprenyl-3-methyl-5-hydroxy-6-metoxy-1,4-benzoquinol methylase
MVGRDKKVLEVGCASGAMTRCLKEQLGCRVTGVEVNGADAQQAAPHCESLQVGDIEQFDFVERFGAKSFDVVTYADVLEHLKNPTETLRKTRAALNDDGYIVASVPNIAHAALVMELARGNFDYRSLGLLDDTHIRFFTKQSLLRTFEQAGFAVVKLERFSLEPKCTEFDVEPRDDIERQMLDFFLHRHPESKTYQFIVKAIPLDREFAGISSATEAFQASIAELERKLIEDTATRHRFESELKWLSGRWPFNWIQNLRRAIR